MSVQIYAWENHLLARATEALSSPIPDRRLKTDSNRLDYAYQYCAAVTRSSSRTFHLSASLLPAQKRRAIYALYAFCRATDDLVDDTRGSTDTANVFATWRLRLSGGHPASHDPVPLAWADAQTRHGIPRGYAEQLIDGIARDLVQNRYMTFAELTEYCYGVASTVGLIVMHIVGFRGGAALPYAIKLGVALQLTNILRDVGEDWRAGRLYLPVEELAEFGLSEADIAAGRIDDRWRAFMRFQIERARTLYQEAEPGVALLDADGRFAIGAASTLYRAILDDIEAHDYDVFQRRAHIGLWGKLRRLPGALQMSNRSAAA
ncbi:MAG TPA: squalene/phytoene synthase family protein [Anaerolineae bacterium]